MSVIHSALKKAEEERKRMMEPYNLSIEAILELAQKNTQPKETPASLPRPHKPLPWKEAMVRYKVLFFGAAAVLILAWIIFPLIKNQPATPPQAPAASKNADAARNQAKPISKSTDKYVITGIVSSGGRWSAMVNDKLVEVGSLIGDARVVSISEGAVTLARNGKKITLYLS